MHRIALAFAFAAALLAVAAPASVADDARFPPCRAITRPPGHHWFGYYDKWQFDPTDRYVLGMEVGFEHRSPKPDDVIKIGMVDLGDGDKWIELGRTRAWNWQQGCMLQWLGGTKATVIWNDRDDADRFVCHVMDVHTRKRRTLGRPVYTVSPDGSTGVTPDFRRIQDMRPGYGYAGPADPHAEDMAPAESGIWRVDLSTGEAELIVTLADIAALKPTVGMKGAKHYFNHLLFGPEGKRFIFLHRWRGNGGKGRFRTRMLTADTDGENVRVVDPSGCTSHFIWKDASTITAWSKPRGKHWGFWEFDERTGEARQVGEGVMTRNGHNTYLPVGTGEEWILNDTYPQGKSREQKPYLFHVPTGRRFPLGAFPLPRAYRGEWRCDTHPRTSRDGTKVCIDSPHGGQGRQMWLIDVSGIVGSEGETR